MKKADISVQLIDYMGGDLTVANSARVSMGKWHEEFDEERDSRLINYLARNGHWSPFAHAFLQFRIKAPIFVSRQLVKHTVGLAYNEISRRYVDEEPEFYFPEMRSRAENVKQGSKNELNEHAELCEYSLADACRHCLSSYNYMLEQGVAPEIARSVLPLNMMTEWIWSGSLMAFVRVCKLRLDPHAQKETRLVAEQIFCYMKELFPHSVNAYFSEEK